jgi:tRNA A-37 threonylcarbamoyl transferase component Bud32
MAYLEINPKHADVFHRQGLTTPEAILAVPNVIVCGHPNRHVARVQIGPVAAFLKREHRVPWKDRLANALAGFGWSSKSERERQILEQLQSVGVGCPDWMAVGQDAHGRAFLVVRSVAASDLPQTVREHMNPRFRRRLAVRLGEVVGRLHTAGFDHPDLYAKHVLVSPDGESITFLDWQRTRRRAVVPWSDRRRDLAALQATVSEDLASPADRLAFLLAYLRAVSPPGTRPGRSFARRFLQAVDRQAARLRRQRRVREMLKPPTTREGQELLWLDGESLCVTPAFHACLDGRVPDWLGDQSLDPRVSLQRRLVTLPDGRRAVLVRRRLSRPLAWLRSWLRGRVLVAPEVEQAGTLFRLQRCGIDAPRLLAFGQRHTRPWATDSLMLTESPSELVAVVDWLRGAKGREKRSALRRLGGWLRDLHDVGCYVGRDVQAVSLRAGPDGRVDPALNDVAKVRARRRPSESRARAELRRLHARLPADLMSRSDKLRFVLGYSRVRRLTPELRAKIRTLQRRVAHV